MPLAAMAENKFRDSLIAGLQYRLDFGHSRQRALFMLYRNHNSQRIGVPAFDNLRTSSVLHLGENHNNSWPEQTLFSYPDGDGPRSLPHLCDWMWDCGKFPFPGHCGNDDQN